MVLSSLSSPQRTTTERSCCVSVVRMAWERSPCLTPAPDAPSTSLRDGNASRPSGTELSSIELSWVELNWVVELSWIEVKCTEQNCLALSGTAAPSTGERSLTPDYPLPPPYRLPPQIYSGWPWTDTFSPRCERPLSLLSRVCVFWFYKAASITFNNQLIALVLAPCDSLSVLIMYFSSLCSWSIFLHHMTDS